VRRLVTVLVLLLLVPVAEASAQAKPFGALECAAQEGVRLCQGKVATFDGVPLDVNVTLPAGDAPYPLVLLAHGWGGRKAPLKDANRPGNVTGSALPWAQRGYAVLSITSRGFNESCGNPPQNRASAACVRGWVKLDDTRFEIRDYQHLASLLVDDGLADPQRIGVHGGSYGGGVSNALALLRNRVMNPDGTYAPWRSPKGTPLQLAAAAPYIPWSDLVYSLMPNGRHLDYTVSPPTESRKPYGVSKQSFVSGLFALGSATGYYAPPGADPDADLNRWFARINAGEPYEGDPQIADIADEIYTHHSSISIDRGVVPAPIFIANGWADDIFPVDEALRLYNVVRETWPQVPIAMMHFDTGHQRAQNKQADFDRYYARVLAWMDRHVKGDATAPARTGVETYTLTCPKDAPSGGPFTAPSWREIHPGEVVFRDATAKSVTNGGGDPDVARAIDPIAGPGACAQTPAADEQGTVNYRLPAPAGDGYTLMGSPTVLADVTTTGAHPQLVARLWDVGPDGRQTLVARTVYRPEPSGRQVFQLHPSGWRFAPGHVAKLQLLGRDAPYARPSTGAFSVTVKDLELRLPVAERPGGQVGAPQPSLVPAGATPVRGTRVAGRRAARRPRLKLQIACRRVRLRGADVRLVRRLTVSQAGMRARRDRRRPFSVALRGRGRTVRATAVLRDGRVVRYRGRTSRRCR
jgi:fermentation-respiration switch protein FrsA (DUF1100 family)